jgi:DNA ligase D-like protein (predicted 3'-phosphoesterase)
MSQPTASFVIQKHDATRLHYDFRLEIDGVLVSWAVPKGPSLDPSDKRLAMMVDDHPMEWGSFEGVIGPGYGQGPVIVWERGTYSNLREDESMAEGLEHGRIRFELQGQKLRGGFSLRQFPRGGKNAWLLAKLDDEHAVRGSDITSERPESVDSGRNIEDLAS